MNYQGCGEEVSETGFSVLRGHVGESWGWELDFRLLRTLRDSGRRVPEMEKLSLQELYLGNLEGVPLLGTLNSM